MKNMLKITVITICKNEESKIENTIKSVISQNYDNFEYVIIDGKSKDGTLSKIDKYKEYINNVISERDNGIYYAMNKGLCNANGDYIIFMNAGDKFYDKNSLSNLALAAHVTNADMIGGQTIEIDKYGNFLRKRENYINLSCFFTGIPICHQALLYRKSLHDEFGLYDTRYRIVADFDFEVKVLLGGKKFCEIPCFTTYFVNDGVSATNLDLHYCEGIDFKRKYFPFIESVDDIYLGFPYKISDKNIKIFMDKYCKINELLMMSTKDWLLCRKKFFKSSLLYLFDIKNTKEIFSALPYNLLLLLNNFD